MLLASIFLPMEAIALGAASFCVVFRVDLLSLKGIRPGPWSLTRKKP
jgi:hypothetical protein